MSRITKNETESKFVLDSLYVNWVQVISQQRSNHAINHDGVWRASISILAIPYGDRTAYHGLLWAVWQIVCFYMVGGGVILTQDEMMEWMA
jgi:hypothetical protein